VDIAAEALAEVGTYRSKAASFAGPLAYKMASDGKTTPGTHFIYPGCNILDVSTCDLPGTHYSKCWILICT